MKLIFKFFFSLFICFLIISSSAFSEIKFNYIEHFWELFEKNNAFDNEDSFFKIADTIKLITEKKWGFLPHGYRYFQFDLTNQKYDTKKFRKAIFHYMRGLYFNQLDLFSKSFEEFQTSGNLFQEIGANLYVFDSYMMNAINCFWLKDSTLAYTMIDNAKKYLDKIDNDTARWDRTAVLNWNYGKYYLAFNHLNKAKFHLDSARRLIDLLMKLNCIYQVYWNYYIVYHALSKYYVKKGLLDSALIMLDFMNSRLQDYANLYPDKYEVLCQIYKFQKDYKSIIQKVEYLFQYYSNMLSPNKDELILLSKLYLYDDLADAYYNLGEKDKAYQILKELNDINIKKREDYKPLQAINAKFELEGKLREKELKQQMTNIFFASITLIILISGLIYYNRFRKIRKLNRRLNELNETKNRLFSIISHDLRGPIVSINQLLENIISNFSKIDDESKQKFIKNIFNSTRTILILLENLLQWSQFQIKSSKVEKHTVDICEVIQSVLEQTDYLIQPKNIKINIDCKQTDTLYINRNELEVIIRNLLTNALKFSPQNGIIEIKSYKQNDKLIIEVADEGIGFTNSSNTGLTNSTVATNGVKKSKDGTGFGLIIVRDILNRNNGEINFKPNNSKGTIAQVIFYA